MKIILTVILFLFAGHLSAQKKLKQADFSIADPAPQKVKSFYKTISLVDLRQDTVTLGIAENYQLSTYEAIVPKISLRDQLQNFVLAAANDSSENGRLVMVLQDFVMQPVQQRAHCFFRAALYAERNGMLYPLAVIDTVNTIKSSNASKKILAFGSQTIRNLIGDHLQDFPQNSAVVYNDQQVLNPDSIAKRKRPLYTADTLKDGIYKNYTSFMMQRPDITEFEATVVKEKISFLSVKGKKGRYDEPVPDGNYAFVYKGQPYIFTLFGFYKLNRIGDDYYFTGEFRSKDNGVQPWIGPSFAGGFTGIGIGLYIKEVKERRAKIDYRTGGFIVSP